MREGPTPPPFQDMAFGEITVLSHFWTNPCFCTLLDKSQFFQNHAFFPKLTHKYTLKLLLHFISYCFFKTSSIISRYKMPLEDYKEHFEGWLKDLKKTGGYWPIVERHEYNWSNIYSDLNRLFKDEVWNQVLEQRARERDQYNDCTSIPRSRKSKRHRGHVSSF